MPETISRVLAFSNEGVHLDAFNSQVKPIPCICCKLGQEWIAYSTSLQLIIRNTATEEEYVHSIAEIKSIECLLESTVSVITKSEKMYLIQKGEVLYSAERVKSAALSRDYLAYTQETDEPVSENTKAEKSISKTAESEKEKMAPEDPAVESAAEPGKEVGKTEEPATEKTAEGNSAAKKPVKTAKPVPAAKKEPVFLKIQKKQGMCTAAISKAKPRVLKVYSIVARKEVPEIKTPAPLLYSVTNKCLVTVRVYKGSGGEIEIIRMENGEKVKKQVVLNLISASLIQDTKYSEERMICMCSLDSKNDTYYDTKALYYMDTEKGEIKLMSGVGNPITDVAFLKKSEFAVCYDNSPSKVSIFNSKAEKVKTVKDGIRNKIFFNRQENIVCFAGMNNLPGNMELFEYPSEMALSVNEEIGCSVIDWSPEGRYYIVGITSKMSIDNKILLFDYYSQKIAELAFSELKGCIFAGKSVPFSPVESPPAKIQMKKTTQYVPPSLRKGAVDEETGWIPAHIIKDKGKAKENKIAAIRKELMEIEKIEQLMSKGQVVQGGILKIQKKESLLKKLNKKKKPVS
ncbi:translation initiation factor 2A [Nematocida minor]|uniref:translation initiation factor 2A n=1 Tax=Nematocida minor TaxID=1912983 RepID=UPI0022203BF3|nr:translation initiation factor 2A [Nematocida minor]KAI5190276.1 translation initiation factor 2A [Nematocida minor]